MRLCLISCTKRKKNYKCKASEMYSESDWFREAFEYAKNNYDVVGILSAKYKFLLPDDIIEPYDKSLREFEDRERRKWAEDVIKLIDQRIGLNNIKECHIFAGKMYWEHLAKILEEKGIKCEIPLKGMGIRRQKKWFKQKLKESFWK